MSPSLPIHERIKRRTRAAVEATVFGREILRRNFPKAKVEIVSAQSKRNLPSRAEIPVSATGTKMWFSARIFFRRQWLCKADRDGCRQKFSSPRRETNPYEDCPRASSSTRRFAATPNVRRASPQAKRRQKICRYGLTQSQTKLRSQNRKQIQFSEIQTSVPLGSKSKSGIKSASARWMQPCDAGWPMDFWSAVPWM